ncbi:hypothetical protein F3Y22_tig00110556pilonHSYRG00089 [Hibiscus syriacus]|uniref:Reverse transcriptase domain-containing protein n=1 Tax=Hibiscus syriacus TaxID=106335 RepID=A0A6A3A9A2_HIBSY|nr:hypothetical protein F3Y22_tig00110556pilonHSYRG00089 [Hibiscus syriacus]
MASRNQSQPPRCPATSRGLGDENTLDKRRRIGAVGRGTAKYEHAAEHNKRLKLCVKWFEQCDENHVLDNEKLKNSLESAEKKCIDTELEKKKKEEELNAVISEFRDNNASLQEMLSKEVSEKQDAINLHRSEIEARLCNHHFCFYLSILAASTPRRQQPMVALFPRFSSFQSTTYVRTTVGDTEAFPVEIGLHQGSALSPYIFALIMDDIYCATRRCTMVMSLGVVSVSEKLREEDYGGLGMSLGTTVGCGKEGRVDYSRRCQKERTTKAKVGRLLEI